MQTENACRGLTSTYGEKTLFDDISFIINKRMIEIGLIVVLMEVEKPVFLTYLVGK